MYLVMAALLTSFTVNAATPVDQPRGKGQYLVCDVASGFLTGHDDVDWNGWRFVAGDDQNYWNGIFLVGPYNARAGLYASSTPRPNGLTLYQGARYGTLCGTSGDYDPNHTDFLEYTGTIFEGGIDGNIKLEMSGTTDRKNTSRGKFEYSMLGSRGKFECYQANQRYHNAANFQVRNCRYQDPLASNSASFDFKGQSYPYPDYYANPDYVNRTIAEAFGSGQQDHKIRNIEIKLEEGSASEFHAYDCSNGCTGEARNNIFPVGCDQWGNVAYLLDGTFYARCQIYGNFTIPLDRTTIAKYVSGDISLNPVDQIRLDEPGGRLIKRNVALSMVVKFAPGKDIEVLSLSETRLWRGNTDTYVDGDFISNAATGSICEVSVKKTMVHPGFPTQFSVTFQPPCNQAAAFTCSGNPCTGHVGDLGLTLLFVDESHIQIGSVNWTSLPHLPLGNYHRE